MIRALSSRRWGCSGRRGSTLAEVSVACALGVLLVYLVAMSGGGFARAAALVAARAELVREADLAVALLADSLRDGDPPVALGIDGEGPLAIGADLYATSDHRLLRNGEPVAWHVASITLSADAGTIRLRMQCPDRYEDRARTRILRRDVYLMVPSS